MEREEKEALFGSLSLIPASCSLPKSYSKADSQERNIPLKRLMIAFRKERLMRSDQVYAVPGKARSLGLWSPVESVCQLGRVGAKAISFGRQFPCFKGMRVLIVTGS